MSPRLRSTLSALPGYVPGRKVPGAVILASNESPYGLLPSVAEVLAQHAAGVSRYPDMGCQVLIDAIAARHDVEPERVAVGAGSVEVCSMLAHAAVDGAQDEILFAWRAFEAYPIITAVAGASAVRVPLAAGHVHDVDAMAAAVTDATRLVFVCNPNNPTGTGIGVDALRRLVDTVDERALVVVDEAYHEYADAEAVPDAFALFADRPNVVVTRTFSKAYGLAGLRVGYCLAAPDVAAAVRKCQTPFSVTALAQHAAVAALGDEEEMRRRVKLTVAERERVQAALLGAGYQVPASQANFVWLALGEATTDVAERCLEAGVVIRPFTGEGARVTIGTSEENDAFLTAALGATAASLP